MEKNFVFTAFGVTSQSISQETRELKQAKLSGNIELCVICHLAAYNMKICLCHCAAEGPNATYCTAA